jgi:hypothetical protein
LVSKKNRVLVTTTLLLAGLLLIEDASSDARAESAYLPVGVTPPLRDEPTMTVDEQSKLKKELSDARDRQTSNFKAKDDAQRSKSKKP